ncbi:MAG: L-2-hydroxyglutarate oxidase [Planctomycetota bacterium]
MERTFDFAIVGGGIVGLAAAHCLRRAHPSQSLCLIEKESRLAAHQTGNNSGVIHSGLYYKPGSAKARTCVRGGDLLREFCREHGIRFEDAGKVVVAVRPEEVPALEALYERGLANGIPDLALIGPERLQEIEPHARGVRALHVPHAGIVDYVEVARKLGELIAASGGEIRLETRLVGICDRGEALVLETTRGPIEARYLIACAGLQSDRVARLGGGSAGVRIVPFRGEYYELAPERDHLVKALIYPVPDARFPFLGVHFTRKIRGGVEAGPNAVLAFRREGYRKSQVSVRDLAEVLFYPGFWKLAAKYWKTGTGEMVRSFSKRAFVRALAKLVPEIRPEDVRPAGAGVRAQALARSGALVDDFLIAERPRALHVLNAPSPAATAALAIGEEIVRRASEAFRLGPPGAPAGGAS